MGSWCPPWQPTWKMSLGSLGHLGNDANGGLDEEDDDEDEDGKGAPETDWKKAWVLLWSLGCGGGIKGLDNHATRCGNNIAIHGDMEDEDNGWMRLWLHLIHDHSFSSHYMSTLGNDTISLIHMSANVTVDEAGIGMGNNPMGLGFFIYSPNRDEVYNADKVGNMSPIALATRRMAEGHRRPHWLSRIEGTPQATSRILLDHFNQDSMTTM